MLAENLNVVAPEAGAGGLRDGGADVGRLCRPRGRRHGALGRPACCWCAVGLWVGFQPEGTRTAFDGSLRQRRLRALRQGDDPVRRRGDAGAEPRLSRRKAGLMKFEYPVLIVLVGRRHDDHGLGAGPDRALHGARAADLALYVVAAFRRDSAALDRGGAEVLRARRAVLGAAALRREPDLRLCRHHGLRRHRRGDRRPGRCRSGWCSGWCSSPPASPSRSRRRRSTCGRPTSTRARRRR